MKNYIVYTRSGEYHVSASSETRAKECVVQLTNGAVSRGDMYVEACR
jgi:hypothetical protein